MKDEIKRGAVALAGILSGLLVCGILMRLIGAPSPEPSDPVTAEYRIEYRAIENGEEKEIYAPLYQAGGNYPTTYETGKETEISDLNGRVTRTPAPDLWGGVCFETGAFPDPQNPNKEYEFEGWYLDEKCTEELENGIIPAGRTGNIVLYAKIQMSLWTNYF